MVKLLIHQSEMVKEQEVVKVEDDWNKRRFSGKAFLILFFFLLCASLLVYAFYDEIPSITGKVIGSIGGENSNESNSQPSFDIRAEIGELNSYLQIEQNVEKIVIELEKSDASILFGNEGSLNLSNLDRSRVEIEGFRGVIVFDKDKIYSLNGNVFKMTLNEIPTSSLKSEMKISINKELNYQSLELDSVYLKKYESTLDNGKVSIDDGKVSLTLDEEDFYLQEFFGKLESGLVGNFGIKKKGLILDGEARGVDVGGKFDINLNIK